MSTNFCYLDVPQITYISRIYVTKHDNSLGNNIPIRWACDIVINGVFIDGIPCNEDSYAEFTKEWAQCKQVAGIKVHGRK